MLYLNVYVMFSVFFVLLVVKLVDYMKWGRFFFFRINWRVIIGIFLVFMVVLVYYLLMLSVMVFCGYFEWEGNDNGIFYCEDVFVNGGCFIVLFFYG